MSKEVIKPSQFAHADRAALLEESVLNKSEEQLKDLAALYTGMLHNVNTGKLVKGTILRVDNDGVLVDINFKSDGFIPRYEFSEHELKKFKAGDQIEVILDELESTEGNVILSYEKAKALRHGMKLSNSLKKVNLLKVLLPIKLKVA